MTSPTRDNKLHGIFRLRYGGPITISLEKTHSPTSEEKIRSANLHIGRMTKCKETHHFEVMGDFWAILKYNSTSIYTVFGNFRRRM